MITNDACWLIVDRYAGTLLLPIILTSVSLLPRTHLLLRTSSADI